MFEELAKVDFEKLEGYKVLSELDKQLLAGLCDPQSNQRRNPMKGNADQSLSFTHLVELAGPPKPDSSDTNRATPTSFFYEGEPADREIQKSDL